MIECTIVEDVGIQDISQGFVTVTAKSAWSQPVNSPEVAFAYIYTYM